METQNSVSRKIRILHKINKKWYFKQKCQASYVCSWSSMFISMHSIFGWASFCMNYCINAAWHGGNQPVALLRCNEAQAALIVAFRSSALLGLVSLIFFLTIPHIFSMGFGSLGSPHCQGYQKLVQWPWCYCAWLASVIEPAFGTFGSVGRCQVLLENRF